MNYLHSDCLSADWDGWQQVNVGPRSFFWKMDGQSLFNQCINQSGSFSYTLKRDKKYLFYSSWTGADLEIRVTIYCARTALEPPEGARLSAEPVPVADELVTIVPDYRDVSSLGADNFQCILMQEVKQPMQGDLFLGGEQ